MFPKQYNNVLQHNYVRGQLKHVAAAGNQPFLRVDFQTKWQLFAIISYSWSARKKGLKDLQIEQRTVYRGADM